MTRAPAHGLDELEPLASPATLAWALAGVAVGAGLALVALPDVAPALARSLAAPEPRTWWFLSRASGLVSYALFSASMLLGLLLSTRFAKRWPGSAAAFALHEHTSVLALAFALFHAIVLLGDRTTSLTALGILLPFGAAYRPQALGLGQLALYGTALLVGSFHVKKHLGQRTWRLLHFLSFLVFVLALGHGLAVGTDRAAMFIGILPVAAVTFFATHRALASLTIAGGTPQRRDPG